MPGLWGCWCSDALHDAPTVLGKLAAQGAHRGRTVRQASPEQGLILSIGHDELEGSNMPGFYQSADCVVTFDGYLSDRSSRAAALDLSPQAASAYIVAQLLRRYGVDGLEQLTGHFACAVWRSAERQLLLARDALGLRPLFFARRGGLLGWSSSVRALATVVTRNYDIDDEFIADYFTRERQSTRTPFRDISAIEPGSVIRISDHDARTSHVWTVGAPARTSEASDPVEYRERLGAAVAAVTDETSGHVFAELSGGVDSSSIVCIADCLHSSGQLRRRVETISHRYDQSPTSDELEWITAVEHQRDSVGHHLFESMGWLFEDIDRAAADDQPSSVLCFGGLVRQCQALMHGRSGAVLLSGVGGDQVMLGDRQEPLELADLLRNGQIAAMFAVIPAWSRALRRSALSLVVEAAALVLSPRMTCRLSGRAKRSMPPWLHPTFVRSRHLERRFVETSWPGDRTLGPAARYRLALIRDAAAQACVADTRGGNSYIDTRYPFLEPQLVRWALQVPFGRMTRPDDQRVLARHGLRDVLPEEIWQRQRKRGPNEAILRAVEVRWNTLATLLERPQVVERGYVDKRAWADSLTRARHGAEPDLYWFVKTLGLEIWLQHLTLGTTTRPVEAWQC